MSQTPVRVRFAPSPTGLLHVGSVRTALYVYLLARQTGGSFILRIEDTDQKRFNPEAFENFKTGLQFLGLEWDEGPDIGGDYGPYVQTERLDIYQKHVQMLIDNGDAYYCFCSSERLAEVNEARQKAGLSTGYDRTCRNLDPATVRSRVEAGESHVVRIKIPLEGAITYKDYLRGNIIVETENLQDAVMIKSDGIPTYNFAVIVDDHLMEITHILRGQEFIASTPLYQHIYHCFGWQAPIFVHLPVILSPTGKGKMSKRELPADDGTVKPVFVHTFATLGYLPEALFNYLALVGWSYDGQTEIMSRQELIERFSLDKINVSPAAWDYDKLDHFNGVYIRNLSVEDLTDRLLPFLEEAGLPADRETMLKITPLIQERLTRLNEVSAWVDFFFIDELPPYDLNLLVPRKMTLADVPPILELAANVLADLEFTQDALEAGLRQAAKENGFKAGQMFQPIRVAIAGKKVSPPLFESLEVLGKEKSIRRIQQTLQQMASEP